MTDSEVGRDKERREEQRKKAEFPREVTDRGTITDTRYEQEKKAVGPIDTTPVEIIIAVIPDS